MASLVRYQQRPAVQRHLAGGRMLVQALDAATSVSLSGSAPAIWELLEVPSTVDELTDALIEQYSDTRERIEVGVRAALDSFESQELLDMGVEVPEQRS